MKKTVETMNEKIKEIKSEFISIIPQSKVEDSGKLLSFKVITKDGIEFSVEAGRCLDISDYKYQGNTISYNAPIGVRSGNFFDYSENSFADNMFFGLLTTCGLENAGPQSVCKGNFYSQHGSINNCEAEDVKAFLSDGGREAYICGDVRDKRFGKHKFVLKRTISYNYDERELTVEDIVENRGKRDQICLMYHYNFGVPFLSEKCNVDISNVSARPKNENAASEMWRMKEILLPDVNNKPQVFYLGFERENMHTASITNEEMKLRVTLSFADDGLPKMDLWKNLRPERYVLSFEPCNAYPYGRERQRLLGEAEYLEEGESRKYTTKIKLEDYNEKT